MTDAETVKRYDIGSCPDDCRGPAMDEWHNGDWVRFEDYHAQAKALLKERERAENGFDYSCHVETGRPAAVVWVTFYVADWDDDGTPNDYGVNCYDTRGPAHEARIPIRIPVPTDVLKALSTDPIAEGENA